MGLSEVGGVVGCAVWGLRRLGGYGEIVTP